MARRGPLPVLAVLLLVLAAGCGDDGDRVAVPEPAPVAGCADIVAADARPEGSGRFRFDVTVRSADTGWDKYADAWEVRAADGTVLGVRALAHPHLDEQPFTRSLSGVAVPAGVRRATVAARDSVAGYCGRTLRVELPR